MEFKAFWEQYITKKPTEISDLFMEVFSQDLPDYVEKEYDVGEVVVEFIGHHETAKEFDKVAQFTELIKNKYPSIYNEEGKYMQEALIKYYCFVEDEVALAEQVKALTAIDYDYDALLVSFKQLQYNQYFTYANQIIEQEYKNVQKADDLIAGAEFDLAIVKCYIELEKFFLTQKTNPTIDNSQFDKEVSQYGFDFDEAYYKHIEIGLFDELEETLQNLLNEFPSERNYVMAVLEMRFLKMMLEKGCPFAVAGMIWYHLFHYFEKKTTKRVKNWSKYFKIELSSFKDYVEAQGGFLDNRIETVLITWGSSYVLDFLYKLGLILERNYYRQKSKIEQYKEDFKRRYSTDLWQYAFVHKWAPADGITSEEWTQEKNLFTASFDN